MTAHTIEPRFHPRALLRRALKIDELMLREQRRQKPDWLRLMRLKGLALKVKQRMIDAAHAASRDIRGSQFALRPVRVRTH